MADSEATQILQQLREGDDSAADRLLPLVYDDLRALAHKYFRGDGARHTLQPTALVHEVFVRLVHQPGSAWQDRAHFFAVCARAMRAILTDYARRKRAAKRGGGWNRVAVEPLAGANQPDPIDALALSDALEELATLNEHHAQLVELRFLAGLTTAEIADVLQCSESSVERQWRAVRAWLSRRLQTAEHG